MGALEELLPDDLMVQVVSFLSTPLDLARAESTNRRFRRLPTCSIWRDLCLRTFPRDYCGEEGTTPLIGWKSKYRFIQQDLRRTELTTSELEGLEWQIHFIQQHRNSGIINSTTERLPQESPCYFVNGRLFILEYLWRFALLEIQLLEYEDGGTNENDEAQIVSNMLWENRQYPYLMRAVERMGLESLDPSLSEDLRCSYRQCLRIADFALHSVARTKEGGWLIWNKHVALVSRGTRRGKLPLPEDVQQHVALLERFDW